MNDTVRGTSSIRDIMQALRRNLTPEEWEKLLCGAVATGDWMSAIQASEKLGRALTATELRKMFRSLLSIGSRNAMEVAEKMPEPARKRALNKVLRMFLQNGLVSGAEDTARLLGEELTRAQYAKMIRSCIRKKLPERAINVAKRSLAIFS